MEGVLLNCKIQMVCERPPPLTSLAAPPHEGENNACNMSLILPLVRGRAAEGGRGSLTHHLDFAVE
jgi:hypothetical protein